MLPECLRAVAGAHCAGMDAVRQSHSRQIDVAGTSRAGPMALCVPARQVSSASIVNRSVDQGHGEMLLPTLQRVDRPIRRYTRLVPILDTTLDHENVLAEHPSRWAEDRIGRSEVMIARWRSDTAPRGPNRGFVPQEPALADGSASGDVGAIARPRTCCRLRWDNG